MTQSGRHDARPCARARVKCGASRLAESGDLAALVRQYRREDAPWLEEQLRYYSGLMLDEAIRTAALARTPKGKKHGHQRRIPPAALEAAAKVLASVKRQIEACRTFEQLHDLVESVTLSIRRFGVLARYDTALRIGARVGE